MEQRELSVLMAALFVTSLQSRVSSQLIHHVRVLKGTAFLRTESATLWSRDADNYISQEEYRQRYGEDRTSVHQLANGTDITFKRPPATAATWTRNDFEDLDAGGSDTSVHPPPARIPRRRCVHRGRPCDSVCGPAVDSGSPQIRRNPTLHRTEWDNTWVRRLPRPCSKREFLRRTGPSSGRLLKTRSRRFGCRKTRRPSRGTDGTHTPAIDYQITDDWSATLSLEAEIHVRLKKTIRTDVGNGTNVDVVYREETRNVSDSVDVEIYDLSAYPYYAEYPNGDAGVAIFQSRPWQGYTLTDEGNASVRGVWRFYTARNTNWDTLVRSNRTDSAEVESDAIPVYVHAYPSRIGPRAEPVRDGPEIIDTWGTERPSRWRLSARTPTLRS